MRIIIGISGASGVIMGERLLRELKRQSVETHLVITDGAARTFALETNMRLSDVGTLATAQYAPNDMGAPIASGTFAAEGMIVMPCSMKTAAGIVCGYADNLLLRAADACLKERRKIVLVPRETPLSPLHLKNLHKAAKLGCTIVPPVLTFYNGAETIEAQICHIIGKVLGQFSLPCADFKPWTGENALNR